MAAVVSGGEQCGFIPLTSKGLWSLHSTGECILVFRRLESAVERGKGHAGCPLPSCPPRAPPPQDLTEREGGKVGLVTGGRATLLPQHLL